MTVDTGIAPYTADDVAPPEQPPGTVRLPPAADYSTALAVAALWDPATVAGHGPVRLWRGEWLEYVHGVWQVVPAQRIVDRLYAFTDRAVYWQPPKAEAPGEWKPWAPSRRKIGDLNHAMAAVADLHHDVELGGTLGGQPVGNIVNTRAGLLDLDRRTLAPHTPTFFTTTQIAVVPDPDAPPPARWLTFLHEVFGGDAAAVAAVQAWFGYVLSGRTHLQKALFIRGERRSGKSTIARILSELVGSANVAAPTASSFGSNFGMQALLGKSLAITGDLRAKRDGQEEFVERILSITGEDTLTVDRKNREPWSGRIPARLMFLSNDAPGVVDSSGALASRFILLETSGSWLGREDLGLERALVAELPGILNWALDGYAHIAAGGRIVEPASSEALREDVDDLGSSETAFLRDCCETGSAHEEDLALLHAVYLGWRHVQGHHGGKAKRRFAADIRGRLGGGRARKSNGRTLQPGVRVADDLPDDVRRAAGEHLDLSNPAKDDPRIATAPAPAFGMGGLRVVP